MSEGAQLFLALVLPFTIPVAVYLTVRLWHRAKYQEWNKAVKMTLKDKETKKE